MGVGDAVLETEGVTGAVPVGLPLELALEEAERDGEIDGDAAAVFDGLALALDEAGTDAE